MKRMCSGEGRVTSGTLLTNNQHQYRMPTAIDYPPAEVYIADVEDPYFAYSATGGDPLLMNRYKIDLMKAIVKDALVSIGKT
jgi:hypothetical protein